MPRAYNRTPPEAWEGVVGDMQRHPGLPVWLWWYGPKTSANPPWMRDKLRRLGVQGEVDVETVTNRRGQQLVYVTLVAT